MNRPHYDTQTDEIKGCKKGTKSYYHEVAHKNWYKKGIDKWLLFLQFLFLEIAIIVAVRNDVWFVKIIAVIPITLYIISEAHAEIYARMMMFKKSKRRLKNDKRKR